MQLSELHLAPFWRGAPLRTAPRAVLVAVRVGAAEEVVALETSQVSESVAYISSQDRSLPHGPQSSSSPAIRHAND